MERDIVKRIEDLMDLFDEGEVTTADEIERPEDPFRDFNERNPMAGGGRIGFKKGTLEDVKNLVQEYNKIIKKDFDNGDLSKTKTFKKFLTSKIDNAASYVETGRKLGATDLFEEKRKLLEKLISEDQDKFKYTKWNELESKVYKAPGKIKRLEMYKDLYDKHMSLNGPEVKVNKAFNFIISNDVPLKAPTEMSKNLARRGLLNQTIADLTGLNTITVNRKGIPVGQWLSENNKLYQQNKELIDYANKSKLFKNAEGKSLQTILDDAAYRLDGNIVWSDSFNTQRMRRPSKNIFTYALKHFNYHGKNRTGRGKVQFYEKGDTEMLNPIKWDDIPSEDGVKKLKVNDVFFTFADEEKPIKTKWNVDSLDNDHKLFKDNKKTSGLFDDLFKARDVYDKTLATPVNIRGKQETFGQLMADVYKVGFNDLSKSPFAIDHIDGVNVNPFKNLRIASSRINVALGIIPRLTKFGTGPKAEIIKQQIGKELAKGTFNIKDKNVIPNIIKAYTPLARDVAISGERFDKSIIEGLGDTTKKPVLSKSIIKNIETGKSLKVFKTLLAPLGGGNCGNIKNQGGRVEFQDGTPNIDVCYNKALKRINSGFKDATASEAKNYTKLLNAVKGSAVIGKNLLKFGIVPEALYVGADTLVRMGYGDTFKEAGLRAADFFIPGDQMQEADKLKVQRTLGDAAATNVGKVFDYRNQIANINSLEQQKQNFENLSGGGAFDYVGDLSQDIKNIDTRLNQAKNNLQNKFMVSEAETVAADKALEEAYDISKAKSPLARLKSFAQNIEAVQDDPFLSDIAIPQKTQMDLNLKMLPQMPRDFLTAKTSDLLNRTQYLKSLGYNVSTRDLMAEQDALKSIPLQTAAEIYSPEQVYGTQGTFFGQPLAGGGIAGLSGGDKSGPPPESGPNPQGLPSLLKRVKNL